MMMRKEVMISILCLVFFGLVQAVSADIYVIGVNATPNPAAYEDSILFLADVFNITSVNYVNLTLNTTPEITLPMTFNGLNYTAALNASDIGLGNYTITVYTEDIEGNTSTFTSSVLIQDLFNPSFEYTDVPVSVCYGDTFTVVANITDNVALAYHQINIEGTYYDLIQTSGDQYALTLDSATLFTGRGSYVFDFYAQDTSENGVLLAPEYLDVLDCTAPYISGLGASPAPVGYGSAVTLTSTLIDNESFVSGTVTVRNSTTVLYTGPLVSVISGEYNVTFNTSILGNIGTYIFTVNATNVDGYSSTASSTFSVIDNTKPVIVDTALATPVIYGRNLEISATVTDDIAVSKVRVLLNGTYYTMTDTGSNMYQVSINSTRLHGLGSFTYTVYSNDTSGNNADTLSESFDVVDQTAPTISAVTETADPLALGNAMTLAATVVDDISSIESVTVSVEGTLYTMSSSGSRYYATFTPSSLGTYDYTIYARDSHGNENSYDGSFSVTDQTKPIIGNLVAPTKVNQNDTITFSADVTDNTGVSTVTLTINGTTYTMTHTSGNTYQLVLDTTGMNVAHYSFTIRATDAYSNSASTTGSVWVTYIVPLYATIRTDKNSGEEDLAVSFTSVVTGGVGSYTYHWNFGNGETDANMNTRYIFTRDGVFNVTLTVYDQYGNEGTDTVTITVGEEKVSKDPRNNIRIAGLSFDADAVAHGEPLIAEVKIENIGSDDLEDLSLTLFIEELGIWARTTGVDVDEGDTAEKSLALDIPYDVEPGDYTVRIVISNDEMKRVKYRDIEII